MRAYRQLTVGGREGTEEERGGAETETDDSRVHDRWKPPRRTLKDEGQETIDWGKCWLLAGVVSDCSHCFLHDNRFASDDKDSKGKITKPRFAKLLAKAVAAMQKHKFVTDSLSCGQTKVGTTREEQKEKGKGVWAEVFDKWSLVTQHKRPLPLRLLPHTLKHTHSLFPSPPPLPLVILPNTTVYGCMSGPDEEG